MRPNPQFFADLVAFTEEIFNGNFICCAVKVELGKTKKLGRKYI